MTSNLSSAALLAFVVLLLSCGAVPAQGVPKGEVASPRESRLEKTPEACSVLVAAGVMQLLGAKAEQHLLPGQSGATGPLCLYEQPLRASVSLGLVAGIDKNNLIDAERDRMRRVGGTTKDEPQLGAGAFSSTVERGRVIIVLAFKGDLTVNLQFTNIDAAAVIPFAKRVLASL